MTGNWEGQVICPGCNHPIYDWDKHIKHIVIKISELSDDIKRLRERDAIPSWKGEHYVGDI